ncbi:hypothetical protein NKH84_26645 [Mesorhizobium sp. M0902]|uniref:hypothetical protein n=1 Tax=unclassified Mesorhizobium TaxID=325217 RepID=UPI0033386573
MCFSSSKRVQGAISIIATIVTYVDPQVLYREAAAEGRKAAGMTDAAARAEAGKWARR